MIPTIEACHLFNVSETWAKNRRIAYFNNKINILQSFIERSIYPLLESDTAKTLKINDDLAPFVFRTREWKKFFLQLLVEHLNERIMKYQKKIRNLKFYKEDRHRFDLQRIKEIPIGSLLPETKDFQPWSNRQTYLCPLHNEQTPSFVWYKKDNRFVCFGCSVKGDVIDFYMALYKCDFITALKELSKFI